MAEITQKATVEVRVNDEQAKKELQEMESYAISLKGRLAEAYNAGDTKKIKVLQKELDETNRQLKVMRTNAKNIDTAMNNIGLATPKELNQLVRDINAKMSSGHIQRGSAEWKRYQEQLKLVRAEQKKLNAEVAESQTLVQRINGAFSKWGNIFATATAAVTGISMALSAMRKNMRDKEASAANLKALTGLDDDSIDWLKDQATKLSTEMDKSGLRVSQSANEILDAYMLVGSAKPELLGNKEALNQVTVEAMRLSKAAKMDLREAVDALTLSMNQYGAAADQAAKYTNVMAAGSKAGAAGVESVTAAVRKAGVSAASANVGVEELVGSIETLAEKGIKDEIAGTGLRMFFLKLQTGADETNPKVVGLQTALHNLQNLSAQGIVKRFGAEVYTVAKVLIDGADRVKYYTDAVTGTNTAVEQAAINSGTAEARMAQYKNQMKEAGIVLVEKLNPSLSMLVGWSSKIVRVLPDVIDWLKKYGAMIVYCATVITSYVVAIKLQYFWQNKMKTATGEYIIIQKLKVAWDTAAKASTLLYAAAQATLQGNTTRAAAAMKLFNGIVKANPVGLAVAAITALAGAFYLLSKRTEEARSKQELLGKIQQEAKSKTSAEITQIKALYDAAKNQANSIDARRKLIAEMNRISPEYLSNLNLETIGTKKAKDAINEYCKSLEAMAELESAKNMLTDIDKQIIELKNKTRDNISEDIKWLKILPKHVQTVVMPFAVKWIEQKTDNGEDDLSKLKKEREEYVQIIRKKTEEIFTEKKEEPKPNNVPSVPEETTGETPSEKERKKKLKEDQKKEETQYNNELKEIKEKYLNDLTITEEDYNEMIENAEIAHLERMLEIAGLEPDERAKIQEKILDEKVKWRDKLQKLDDKANKKELKDEQKQNKAVAKEETKEQKEAYERTKRKYNLEIQQATENHYKNRTSDKQFKEELLNIQNSFDKEVLSDLQISDEKKLEIQAKTNENRLKQTEEEYNQYKEKLSNTFNTLSDVAQEFGSEFGDFLSDESKTLGDFAKDVVKIMLSTLEKIMVGAIAERTIKNIASLGVVGVAKAAAEIALISAAFEGAKALIGNFYTGGFTDDGKWDEPKGVVHSNEFVANRFAVRNPQVLPVLKLIDSAQKSNTVGSLTARDISNVLGVTQVATAMPSQVQVPGSYDNSEISSVLSRTAKTIEKLNERLNEPFTTINTVSGRGGIKEATDKYNRLISNKSRGGKAS